MVELLGQVQSNFLSLNSNWFWVDQPKFELVELLESNTSNGSQFEVEIGEIWPIEAILHKKHVVMRLHTGPITFGCLGSFLGLFLGTFFGGDWTFQGFSIFNNPNL